MTFKRFTSLMLAFLLALNLCMPHVAHAEGATEVATLEALQQAITDGATNITLTQAITVSSGDVVIDGKDNAVTITTDVLDVFTVMGGTLTLKNITVNSSNSILYADGAGQTVIDGAKLTSTASICLAAIWNGGKLTMSSGSIVSTNSSAVAVEDAGSEFVINGGTVMSDANAAYAAAYATGGGSIVVNGGEVIVGDNNQSGALVAAKYSKTTGGTVTVNGGTVEGVHAHEHADSHATITGGTFAVDPSAGACVVDTAVYSIWEKTEGEFVVCDHAYTGVETGATCTEDGYTTYTCSKCGHSYTKAGATAKDHSWEWDTEDGMHDEQHWQVCGNDGCDAVGEKANHEFSELVSSTVGANCEEQGQDTYRCECGREQSSGNGKYGSHADTDGDFLCDTCDEVMVDKFEVDTLAELQAAIAAGATEITVTAPIVIDEVVTIDTYVEIITTGVENAFVVGNSGVLTMTEIAVSSNSTSIFYANGGAINLNNCYIYGGTDAVLTAENGGVINVSGTMITSNVDPSSLIVLNVKDNGKVTVSGSSNITGGILNDGGTLNIEGGTFFTVLGLRDGVTTITGGNFTHGSYEYSADVIQLEGGALYVEGENTEVKGNLKVTEGASAIISGGTFYCALADEYIAQGYVVTTNEYGDSIVVAHTPHDWSNKDGVCAICGAVCEHEWVDADCDTPKTCSECGATEGDALGHDYGDATCDKPATCSVCGEPSGEALGHKWVDGVCETCKAECKHDYDEVVTAPTCTEGGYTTYTCTECGHTYKDDETEATGHFHESEVTKEPTCTEPGVTTWTCTNPGCDNKFTTAIDAKGHTEEKIAAQEPTCTKPGFSEGTKCSVCDAAIVNPEVIPALGHTMTHVEAVDATCTEAGNHEYWYCETCEKYFEDEKGEVEYDKNAWIIEKLGHKMTKTDAKAATCTEAGHKEYWTCETCEKLFSDAEGKTEIEKPEAVAALGHDWTKKDGACAVCGETCEHAEKKVIPAVAATCEETGLTEGEECAICGMITKAQEETEKLPHTEVVDKAVAATCTTDGLTEGKHCSVCETVIVEQKVVEALGHDMDTEGKVTTKPTCEAKGVKTFTCKTCGHSYTEEIAALGHTEEVIKAKGHTEVVVAGKAATCTEDGLTEGKKCSVCGETTVKQEVIKALGHNYDNGVVTKEPTTTEKGVKTYTCQREGCKHTKTEEIPMIEVEVKLDAPTVKVSNVASTGKIKVTWSKVEGAEKYEVYRSTTKDGEYTLLTTTTKTSVTNGKNIEAGVTYFYRVRAIASNSAANSAYSVVESITAK